MPNRPRIPALTARPLPRIPIVFAFTPRPVVRPARQPARPTPRVPRVSAAVLPRRRSAARPGWFAGFSLGAAWIAVVFCHAAAAAPIGVPPAGSLPAGSPPAGSIPSSSLPSGSLFGGTPLLGRPLDRLPLNPLPHPAVVRVVAQERNAESHGSGTLIDVREDCGLVVTNWHVVRDAVGKIEVRFPGGFVSPARVRKADKVWDLAALVIWRPPVEPVRISRQPPRRGEPLTIAGYGPGTYRAVAGRCTQYVAPGVNYPPEMVELSAEARQGDSGGPIFNDQGELAGVLFGAARGTTTGSYGGRVREFLASIVTDPGAVPAVPAGIAPATANLPVGSNPNNPSSNFPPPAFSPSNSPSAPLASPPAATVSRDAAAYTDPFGTAPSAAGPSRVAPAIALGQPLSEHSPPPASNSTGRNSPIDAPRFAPLVIPDPASHPLQLPPPPPEAVARQAGDFAEFAPGSNASVTRPVSPLPVLPMPPPPRDAAEPPVDADTDDRGLWASSPFKLRDSPGAQTAAPIASATPKTLEQWLALDGPPAEQAKTVLAVVGALALLSQAGRLFQANEPAPKPKT